LAITAAQDTAGFFARDAASFKTFGKSWYGREFKSFSSFPKRLLVPNDTWPVSAAASESVFAAFISKLQAFLGAETVTTGVSTLWSQTSGINETVQVYMNQTYPTLIGAYQYNNFALPFINDYKAANGGRAPFVDPAPSVRWAFAVDRGAAAFADESNRRVVFQDWVAKELFKASDASCSDGILLYPQSTGRTSYRNIYILYGIPAFSTCFCAHMRPSLDHPPLHLVSPIVGLDRTQACPIWWFRLAKSPITRLLLA
jgi:hypothetical protein